MIDAKLDQQLQDLNRRYQELVYSKTMSHQERKKKYLDNLKTLDIKQIIKDLQYREYAMKNYTTKGNVASVKHVEKLDVDHLKIAVYSCIIGPYDKIIEPIYKEKEIDYLMYTDQEIPAGSTWEKVDIEKLDEIKGLSPVQANRKIKILQTERLCNYDYTVYVDGNIEIVSGVSPIIANMGNSGFGTHFHRSRDCIYDEVVAVKHWKRVDGKDMDQQLAEYTEEGFPKHYGLYENSILIRNNKDQSAMDLMKTWWDEYSKNPTRDQLSLPYVIWKTKFPKEDIYILGNDVERNPRFNRVNQHIQKSEKNGKKN